MVSNCAGPYSRILFFLFLLVLSSPLLNARHIVGGEIFYECLGNGTGTNTRNYLLTMKVYRDCGNDGAAFDNPARFGLYSYINGVYTFIDTPKIDHGLVRRVLSVENACLILPPGVCVEETSYHLRLNNLPVINGSYVISWQRCCRNNSITNIIAPHNTGATYIIEITSEAQRTCNKGPRFDAFPPIGICVNDPIDFDHGATDAEGDELVYEFCAPLAGGGPAMGGPGQSPCEVTAPDPSFCRPPFDEVIFNSPVYSSLNPLGVTSPISLDPLTGFISGTPELVGQFVVGVCVKEYRDGVLLSILRRDFQFNVVKCEAVVEAIIQADSVINQKDYILNSCGENTVNFVNESKLEKNIQSYHWSFDIEGTPQESSSKDATITFPGIGSYTGTMIVNEGLQCGDTAYIHVNILPAITADFSFDYDTCIGGPVNFEDMSFTEAESLVSWDWDFGDEQTSKAQNPDHLYHIPGLHPVSLIVKDNNACRDTMVKEINYFPVPPLLIVRPSKYIACVPEIIEFVNLSFPIDETYDINWDFGDGSTGDDISPVHEYTEEGIYTVNVDITSPIGCFTSATFPNLITIKASPTADFTYTPEDISSINQTAMFTDQSFGGGTGWFWDFGGEGHSFSQNPTYTFRDTGIYQVMQVVFHPNGCSDTLIQNIDVEPIVQFFLPNAFTPNYDGKNEVYKPGGISLGVNFYSLRIWSRWGEELFNTSDPEEGWNGRKFNAGQELPVGVYLCVLEYRDARNRPFELREFVTLLR